MAITDDLLTAARANTEAAQAEVAKEQADAATIADLTTHNKNLQAENDAKDAAMTQALQTIKANNDLLHNTTPAPAGGQTVSPTPGQSVVSNPDGTVTITPNAGDPAAAVGDPVTVTSGPDPAAAPVAHTVTAVNPDGTFVATPVA